MQRCFMAKVKYPTNPSQWAISSTVVFVVLGFIDPIAGVAKGENNWWSKVFLLPSLNRSQLGETVPPVLVYGAILALAAIVLGWVLQALIAVRRGPSRSRYELLAEHLRDAKP